MSRPACSLLSAGVLQKVRGREKVCLRLEEALITLQAYARGLLGRRAAKQLRNTWMQGRLCAQQAAWRAQELQMEDGRSDP